MEDKRANPGNYAIITISEGAKMIGGTVVQRGEPDAYGHRKLGGIGMETGEALKRFTGEDIIFQQLSYLMRSGAPDSLDLMVAVNFANMAMSLALERATGRMTALNHGIYTDIPISIITSGQNRARKGSTCRNSTMSTSTAPRSATSRESPCSSIETEARSGIKTPKFRYGHPFQVVASNPVINSRDFKGYDIPDLITASKLYGFSIVGQ
jgi:6-phosphofructokinase